ncbi:DUF3987 domain-containing protein [Burkholderia pseudomallei]|uniref:DUF3987 domain-containing protein n=1 Tax=Burkholderia pseudomallei TaxID=28450 RepID=UPI000E696FE1|nr:DUF3987 domain-containing protein [Burkholderia pseudomallei]RIV48791.1 DUF3987 domain-containing protein [Burkholderia pseudomallei]RIV63825.1 DUF3987 domain-containing protein [Burkholderia pseudomallei]
MQGNPLPVHALPPKQRAIIGAWARTAAFEILVAGYMDGYVSQAAGPCAVVKTPDGTLLDSSTYAAVCAPSSAGKTPASRPFIEHLASTVAAHDASTLAVWQEYRGRMTAWQAGYSGTERGISKRAAKGLPPDDALANRLIDLERNRPKAPPSPPRRLENFTYSAVIDQAELNRAIFVYSDEGRALLSQLDKALAGLMCSSWSSVATSYSRKGTGVQMIQPSITMILPIQNLTLQEFFQTPTGRHFLNCGMPGRFLWYAVYESMVEPAPENRPVVSEIAELKEFLDRGTPFFHEQVRLQETGWDGRKVLMLSPQACRAFGNAERRVNSIGREGMSDSERACLDKLPEQIIRHAARHHKFDGEDGPITAERIECAEEIALWSFDNFSRLVTTDSSVVRQSEKDADRLFELLFYGLRVRDKVAQRVLRDEAFNIGLVSPTQFNMALGWLCKRNHVYVKNGYVYLIRPDDLVNVLGLGGIR